LLRSFEGPDQAGTAIRGSSVEEKASEATKITGQLLRSF
jgi:hypothetical protein